MLTSDRGSITTMSNQLVVQIEDADHSAQGHTLEAVLTFENMVIWGPKSCHNNIRRLENAIKMADDRFDFTFRGKDETIEGHTRPSPSRSTAKLFWTGSPLTPTWLIWSSRSRGCIATLMYSTTQPGSFWIPVAHLPTGSRSGKLQATTTVVTRRVSKIGVRLTRHTE